MPRLGALEHSGASFGRPLVFKAHYDDVEMLSIVHKHFRRGHTGSGWIIRALEFECMGAAIWHLCEQWLDADGLG